MRDNRESGVFWSLSASLFQPLKSFVPSGRRAAGYLDWGDFLILGLCLTPAAI